VDLDGNKAVFISKKISELGAEKYQRLEELSRLTISRTKEWYHELIDFYRGKVAGLEVANS
jgi:hypothetical protein